MNKPINSNKPNKKWHSNWNGKEEIKLSFVTNNMILYIEYPKDSIKKLLEPINEFSKVTEYKINIQKSVAFLYTNKKMSEKKVLKSHSQ